MLTDEELDVVIRAEPAAVYELRSSDATPAVVRESLRLIARNIEREAYKRAAAECKKIEEWYLAAYEGRASAAETHMHNNQYIAERADSAGECAEAIKALGRKE